MAGGRRWLSSRGACPISWAEAGGQCYKHFGKDPDQRFEWTEAETFCQASGGHLASITSEQQEHLVVALILNAKVDETWIGLTDSAEEGVWVWIDGESLDFMNFHGGEPDNHEECSSQ